MSDTLKFYVVVCNLARNRLDPRWKTVLFEDTISGALAYRTRKDADNGAKKAKQLYGWAKVLRCVQEVE